LNYFSEAVSWEGEERLADADSWRITGKQEGSALLLVCRPSGRYQMVAQIEMPSAATSAKRPS
jgi:hypothetical protein